MMNTNYMKCVQMIHAMEKSKAGKGVRSRGVGMLIFNSMMLILLIKEVTFEQKFEGGRGGSPEYI